MKTLLVTSLAFVLAMGLLSTSVAAEGAQHSYVGMKKCKMCHRSAKTGNQYGIWESSAHAAAYTNLASDKAKEVAAKAGVEGDPQQSDKCLKCHTTGFGVDASLLGTGFVKEDGVQCEACHGPGSDYYRKKVMVDRELGLQNGLVVPDEKICVTCHNEENPTHKEFDFATYFEKIAHPVPEK